MIGVAPSTRKLAPVVLYSMHPTMKSTAGLLTALLLAALFAPDGCSKSKHSVPHDASTPATDGPQGSGGTTVGTGGSRGGTGGATVATGGSSAGTGGATIATGGTRAGTGGATVATGGSGGMGGATIGSGGAAGRDAGPGGGAGGTTGLDGPTAAACPGAPPRDGDPCGASQTCYYEDCAGAGRTVATCTKGGWAASVAACKSVACRSGTTSTTCDAGKLCLAIASGSPVAACAPNTCGAGAIACDCLPSCTGTCTVSGTAADGIVINCNPCPGGCP